MKNLLWLGLLLSTSVNAVPNIYAPGEINPNVTQENIHKTICVPNWTSTVRPSVAYTNKVKKFQIDVYGYKDKNMSHYELDHLLPLSVGGHPSSTKNLWPQPYKGVEVDAFDKDVLERKLHKDVCSGKISLKDAQKVFMGDWVSYYLNNIKK